MRPNNSSTSQEILCMGWNIDVHYCVHKSLPRVSVLSHVRSKLSILLLKDPLQHYQPIYYHVFPVVSFPQVFPPKPLILLKLTPVQYLRMHTSERKRKRHNCHALTIFQCCSLLYFQTRNDNGGKCIIREALYSYRRRYLQFVKRAETWKY